MSQGNEKKNMGNGYVAKSWENAQGNQGTIYYPKGQKSEYPHDTEFRNKAGKVIDEHRSASSKDHDRNVVRNKSFWFQNDPDFGSSSTSSSGSGGK